MPLAPELEPPPPTVGLPDAPEVEPPAFAPAAPAAPAPPLGAGGSEEHATWSVLLSANNTGKAKRQRDSMGGMILANGERKAIASSALAVVWSGSTTTEISIERAKRG